MSDFPDGKDSMSSMDGKHVDDPVAALSSLRDVEPPPSLMPAVMQRVANPAPVTFWTWLRRRRRVELRFSASPLGAVSLAAAAGVLLLVALDHRASNRAGPPEVVVLAPAASATAPPSVPAVVVRFTLMAPGARTVGLAGDFNGWDPAATPLVEGGAGVFAASVPVAPGAHEYMFVVDGRWVTDPTAAERRPDGFGRENAVLRL